MKLLELDRAYFNPHEVAAITYDNLYGVHPDVPYSHYVMVILKNGHKILERLDSGECLKRYRDLKELIEKETACQCPNGTK